MPNPPVPLIPELEPTAQLREAFLSGGLPPPATPAGQDPGWQLIRAELRAAWERSRHAGVHPRLREVPTLLDGPELEEYRAGHELYQAGEPALAAAADLLEGTGCGIVLADARGMVLHLGGDGRMFRVAEQVGSLPGASWREDLAGNNALGTSLVTGRPVQFHFYEHWCEGWTDWVCAAAPVREPEGQDVLGAVALVAHQQVPDPRILAMATRLAGTLERQVQRLRQQHNQELRLEGIKLSRWFPRYLALAVDRRGAVVWANGPVPAGLRRELEAAGGSLPARGWRGDKELLLAGRYPCLVIPIWSGTELQGHLLVTTGAVVPGRARYLVAQAGERRLVFTPEQVLAVRSRGGTVYVLAENGEWPTGYSSMREAQERLPAGQFFQVDRGCLVNLGRIREIHPMFNRTVTLVLADRKGTQIPVSRRRTAALRQLLSF